MLAAAEGYIAVTKVLLIYVLCRDDEQRTGLMLAAAEGHIPVMKILLDNQAVVNDRDKMKVTSATCLFSLTLF